MNDELLLRPLTLAVMGALSVSVWTVRVALTARGRKTAAALTAGVEAVVFAVVFANVLSSLSSAVDVAGYALGVAAGTLLGVVADGRLSTGQSAVRVVVDGDGRPLALALRDLGWPVTRLPGEGLRGTATMLFVVVDDRRMPHLLGTLQQLAPATFWTVERLQTAHGNALPPGYVQVRGLHGSRHVVRWAPRRRRAEQRVDHGGGLRDDLVVAQRPPARVERGEALVS